MKRTLLKFAFVMIAMAVFHSAYAIDKLSKRGIAVKSSSEVTSLDGLKSAEYFFLQDETGKFLYIPSGWDMKVKSELDQNDDYGILYKLQAEGDHYLIPIYNLNKSRRTFWAGDAYVNTQPAGVNDVIFGLGLGNNYGQDGANLALWDVIAECEIVGSSDASIKNARANDLSEILNHAPIQKIIVNGKTAERLYIKYIEPVTGIKAVVLPSTSPANAAWSLDRLVDAWETEIK